MRNDVKGIWSLGLISLELVEISYTIEDYALVRWSDEDKIRKLRLYYNQNNRAYVYLNRRRYYLDECMRVN